MAQGVGRVNLLMCMHGARIPHLTFRSRPDNDRPLHKMLAAHSCLWDLGAAFKCPLPQQY